MFTFLNLKISNNLILGLLLLKLFFSQFSSTCPLTTSRSRLKLIIVLNGHLNKRYLYAMFLQIQKTSVTIFLCFWLISLKTIEETMKLKTLQLMSLCKGQQTKQLQVGDIEKTYMKMTYLSVERVSFMGVSSFENITNLSIYLQSHISQICYVLIPNLTLKNSS